MIFEKVRMLLCEQLSLEKGSISMDTRLEDLGADSLDIVELVMAMEEEFDIQVEDEQVEKIQTVGDIVNAVSAMIE
ncbi:Acyl carrier protein [bioreactor metagenome]|jgi:acyl carrier protein|uniref:Acyl carrier protein n=1 Tax=bioreactor metagenome TaxID=1076179 RepID=A0A644WZN6_9ZZZZ